MIELTVKTLDSQNHSFSVNDDITVAQFKEKIAEKINIPADTQRIIYCGRVLKDEVKLSEYDVNGKVVHLVQRAPPTSGQGPTRTASPQPQRRNVRGVLEHGMYVGSMAFPTNLMESQGIVPPPPTHSLAASRLNVAKRMFRRAEAVLNLLENPQSRNSEQPPSEEPQEEVTPVLEARVIVPSNPMDDIMAAVENSFAFARPVNVTNRPPEFAANEASDTPSQNSAEMDTPPMHSASSTPDGASPVSTSTENLAAEVAEGASGEGNGEGDRSAAGTSEERAAESTGARPRATSWSGTSNGGNANTLAENASRTTEMADLMDTLSRLQLRLAPFLEQYQNFMRNDPAVAAEDVRKMQTTINRVSEVLHFLGHAYHSLSDIIVRVRTTPPRPLLCRPILIQHSAVVQTGFPIQVEAQINISPENLATSNPGNSQSSSSASAATTATSTSSTQSANPRQLAENMDGAPLQIDHRMLDLPFVPGSVRVQSFPFEIRDIRSFQPVPTNVSAASVPSSAPGGSNGATAASNNTTSTSTTAASTSTASGQQSGASATSGSQFNNPNFDFYMEVTPESITIDSLETTLLRSNQSGDMFRGALNTTPPEFLQSIMQMAGQLINRSNTQSTNNNSNAPTTSTVSSSTSAPAVSATTSSPATTTSDSSIPLSTISQTTSSVNAPTSQIGQNSQARGNTQTNPTTATHTRSTARPHVHLTQHALQGGFDPFLPCNSHHITTRRPRMQTRNVQAQGNQNNNSRGEGAQMGPGIQGMPQLNANQLNPLYNIVQGIVNSFRNAYRQQRSAQASQQNAQPAAEGNSSGGSSQQGQSTREGVPGASVFRLPFFPHLQNMVNNISDARTGSQGPTISQILQQLQPDFDETYVEGESLFSDLIVLLSRNLTVSDMIQLNVNHLEPLMRIRNELRRFFLYRVMDGTASTTSIDRAVNRLVNEMQPFINDLGHLQVRNNIDIVRSTTMLFRNRLPNIISLAASRNPNSLRLLVEQCRITLKQLCALVVLASANGVQGIETVLESMLRRHMQGMSRDLEMWMREKLRRGIASLDIPESVLQPYIVRQIDSITIPGTELTNNIDSPEEEPMELDGHEASGSSTELTSNSINLQEDGEPLPQVEIGSEAWHDQVPAEWVPIIVRDTQRQRRQNPQPAFSDAYLSGMPSKRRKIVTSAKPQGSLPQVIQESVRRAVTATALESVAPIEVVSQAAAADINIQSAYRELLRSSVQSTLQNNEDFTPERYPNASNYFNKTQ